MFTTTVFRIDQPLSFLASFLVFTPKRKMCIDAFVSGEAFINKKNAIIVTSMGAILIVAESFLVNHIYAVGSIGELTSFFEN